MEPVADEPAVVQRLLDVFVFAPAGLMVTVIEEFPRLVERGRERLTGQVTSAKTVGSFAVTAGRSQLRKRAEDLRRTRHAPGRPRGGAPAGRSAEEAVAGAASTPSRPASPESAGPGTSATPSGASGESAVPLGIPGFDTLSASQVVQRLDGLTADELVAVRAHETAHRGRRTILNRVEQLLDERS